MAFDGKVGTPNTALDYGMDSIQRLMNNLHMDMSKLASLTEQEIDESEDYKESVDFAERSTDIVTKLVWLLERVDKLVAGFLVMCRTNVRRGTRRTCCGAQSHTCG